MSSSGRKKVLCIWGQGGGYGHAARLLSIARALGKDGHDVHLALRDKKAVQAITGGYRGTISDCPVTGLQYSWTGTRQAWRTSCC